MELATLVNSPIDVTFFVEMPTTDSRLFVFDSTVDGSLSTGPWNLCDIVDYNSHFKKDLTKGTAMRAAGAT